MIAVSPIRIAFVFFFSMFYCMNVFAQSPIDPGARYLQEEQRKREQEQLQNARPGQDIRVATPERVERETTCFDVHTIRLRGVASIDPTKLSSLIDAYKDTCMGQQAISALIQLINKVYVEAGFITTRAYIPEQDLNDGELIIDVLEGRIEGFVYRVVDKDGKVDAGKPRKIAGAFPIKPGEVFQLRAIEQGLDQINRLASSQAKIDLLPGEQPGFSIVVVTEKKEDMIRATISSENKAGDDPLLNRHRLSFEVDDVFGLNDAYSLSYLGTRDSNVFAYNYSIPYGYWTFSSSGSYSESVSPLTAVSEVFNQTGNLSFDIQRLMSRGPKEKSWLYVNGGYFWNSRFVNLAALTPQNRTRVSAGIKAERHFENGVLSTNFGVAWGIPLFGADGDAQNLSQDTPRVEFNKIDFSLNYLHRYKNGSQLNLSLHGQNAGETLFSNEQISIGGWDSIRGYHGAEASGERGIVSRNEYTFLFPEPGEKQDGEELTKLEQFYSEKIRGSMRPYIFADAGYVDNIALKDSFTMVGAGLGIRGNWKRTSIDAALAFPLVEHGALEPGEIQGLINVTFKLF